MCCSILIGNLCTNWFMSRSWCHRYPDPFCSSKTSVLRDLPFPMGPAPFLLPAPVPAQQLCSDQPWGAMPSPVHSPASPRLLLVPHHASTRAVTGGVGRLRAGQLPFPCRVPADPAFRKHRDRSCMNSSGWGLGRGWGGRACFPH